MGRHSWASGHNTPTAYQSNSKLSSQLSPSVIGVWYDFSTQNLKILKRQVSNFYYPSFCGFEIGDQVM